VKDSITVQRPRIFARSHWIWLGGLFLLLLMPIQPAGAAPLSQAVQPTVARDSATQPIDVVVLLDDSGSMATCWPWPQDRPPFAPPCGGPSPNLPSDPNELRYSAARLLIELADRDDRVAVVRFDSDAEGVGVLGELTPIGSEENRRQLSNSLQAPDDYFRRGYTRIDLGLDEAIRLLAEDRQPGRSQYVVLLTDGEPSAQSGVTNQTARVREQVAELNASGALVFPVVLCNPSAGCAGDFLREEFAEFGVREAKSAPDLLQIFSTIVADMKPDRSVTDQRNGAGALQVAIRDAHGAQNMAFVTPSGGLLNVQRDAAPTLARTMLDDANISVSRVDQEQLQSGTWTVDTSDRSGFAVVQAESFPQLLNPPPSIADSAASVRYYPAGKQPLLIAQGVGPGATEPIYFNDETELMPFSQSGTRALALNQAPDIVLLQLGDDEQPLQLVRTFQLQAGEDLPQARVLSPAPGEPAQLEDGRQSLQAGFSDDAGIQEMAGTVFISDVTEDDGGTVVYEAGMSCANLICTDERFTPADGRSYRYTFVLEGVKDDLRFSDWAQTETELAPAIYLRGLPAELDLAQMPSDGWPIELASGTTEEIGSIEGALTLFRVDASDPTLTEPIDSVTLDFNEAVPEEGSVQTALQVMGLDSLRPGDYVGEVELTARSPAGLLMEVAVRPGATLPVTLNVARPSAALGAQTVDFGNVLFDPSPNFRLDQEALVPVDFSGSPFLLTGEVMGGTCVDVAVETGEVRRQAGRDVLPLRLRSSRPIDPGVCSGVLALRGPNGDYDVTPAQLDWRTRVNAVEWSLVDGALGFGDLQRAGEQAAATLLVRYSGETPFVIEMADIAATGINGDEALLTAERVAMPPVEVSGEPDEEGIYEVPVTLTARQDIPFDPLRGTQYAGELALRVVGLDDVQQIGVNFRSPNFMQRYLAPIFVPIYSTPWAFCTVPLTLLLFLVGVARVRSRGIDEDEIEEAAMAATRQMAAETFTPQVAQPGESERTFVPVSDAESVWGQSEWGIPWREGVAGDDAPAPPATDRPKTDPWSESW
jgi:hypothetical protein